MATIKSYTDIEQSRKLAEILPIESADMAYWKKSYRPNDYAIMVGHTKELQEGFKAKGIEYIPCWSLAALLELIPKHIKQEDERIYKFYIFNDDGMVVQRWGCSYVTEDYHNRAEYLSDPHLKYPTNIYSDKYDNPIDACYEMIIKLHEQKLL